MVKRIVYYFENDGSYMFNWQIDNIVKELSHYNITVDIFNPIQFQGNYVLANEKLIKMISTNRCDLFMTCHAEDKLFIETVDYIGNIGIPRLLFCPDNLLEPYFHKNVCRHYDLVWLTSKENSELFTKWGAKWIFLPYAANPYFYQYNPTEEIEEIAFVGNPYGSRANIINALISASIPVALFGKTRVEQRNQKHIITHGLVYTVFQDLQFGVGRSLLTAALKQKINKQATLNTNSSWLHIKGFAESLSEVYSKYALSLATTTARNTGILKHPVPVVNLRSFEVPMCGGIQFCFYNEELANYFIDGKEIVFYKNEADMIEKANYYLKPEQSSLRREIRLNARKKAQNEHTWKCRFENIFQTLQI